MEVVRLPGIADYWRRDLPFHQASIANRISRNRFQEISRFLHFSDNATLPQRGEPGHDRLGKLCPIIEAFLTQFLEKYSPHCEQAVDEAMIPFRSLKQYLPAKPVKRDIKVWCRSDSHNGYISEFQIYTGRSALGEKEINLGGRVVLDLTQKLEGRHYHIYFDNFFTFTTLLSSLLSRGLYACGTARQDYKSFPVALKMKGKGKKEMRRLGLNKRYV